MVGLSTKTVRSVKRAQLDVLLPVVGVILSEAALFSGHPDIALWGYGGTFVGCTAALFIAAGDDSMFAALSFLPLFRLVNLGMPRFTEAMLYWLPLVYGVFLPSLLLTSRVSERSTPEVDAGRALSFLLPAVAIGASLALARSALFPVQPLIHEPSFRQIALLTVVMFGFVCLVEELLFRAILQPELQARLGRAGGIGLTAVLFGTMSATIPFRLTVAFGVVVGLIAGYAYDRSRSLVTVWVMRGTLNVVLYGVVSLSDIPPV